MSLGAMGYLSEFLLAVLLHLLYGCCYRFIGVLSLYLQSSTHFKFIGLSITYFPATKTATNRIAWALLTLSAVKVAPLDIRVPLAQCMALYKAVQGWLDHVSHYSYLLWGMFFLFLYYLLHWPWVIPDCSVQRSSHGSTKRPRLNWTKTD